MNRDYGQINNEYAGSVDVAAESSVYRPRARPHLHPDSFGEVDTQSRDSLSNIAAMPSVVWSAYSSSGSPMDHQVDLI